MRIRSLRNRRLDLDDVIEMNEKQKESCDKRIADCNREIAEIDRRLKALQPPRGATRTRVDWITE
jgi:prefoldin subunit 5